MSFPIQPDPDQDFYVLWSNVVDAAIGWGTCEEVAEMMFEDRIESVKREIERSLERARRISRDLTVRDLTVMEGPGGPGELKASDLYDYAKYLQHGNEASASALVVPFGNRSGDPG